MKIHRAGWFIVRARSLAKSCTCVSRVRSTLRLPARVAIAVLILCWTSAATAQQTAAIASAHPLATAAGYQVLRQGGNAFDAAVAVAATLAVVEPYSSGLGGGGFFLLHRARDGRDVMVDGREVAPSGVTSDLYFDRNGNPIRGASTRGGRAAAIPGVPAALAHIARRYGKLPLGESLAPAIRRAREGFEIDPRFARIARIREEALRRGENTARTYLSDGWAPQPGFLLRQPDLAATLEAIAREGAKGFYTGPVAHALVEAVNAAGGIWRVADLEHYRIVERKPVKFSYRGATITAAALPSAGGIALAQSLGMLERFELSGVEEPKTAHLVIEALRRAFQDRARYLGDSDFVAVPIGRLLSRSYISERSAGIDPVRATRSDDLQKTAVGPAEGGNTTHFSIIDGEGNRVAATLSVNLLFGACIVAPGTGVLVNDEMDDFTLRADLPNSYRLRGSIANAVAPGKRPLSSMTPAFVEDSKGVLVLGTPGGSRIISQVLLAILQYLHQPRVDLQQLVAMPRYHHQYRPDRVEIEPESYPTDWRAALEAMGHSIGVAKRRWGNMQVVFQSRTGARKMQAASDPRGANVGWY